MSLAENVAFLRRLSRTMEMGSGPARANELSPLVEVEAFGSNPGDLRMYAYVPAGLAPQPALVVVLHGCTQKAADYDIGAGWSALARRYGFALLMPEQKPCNNANRCFNWFNPEDQMRDSGEALSIRQMIEKISRDHDIDPDRIFISGLSAGGAMASVLLAIYPDVFAAGAIIAGLPYGVANNVQGALKAMFRTPEHSADELGGYVRAATTHTGPWPRVSVWHGSADTTVKPGNAAAIVRQWANVHGMPETAMSVVQHDAASREVWWDADGITMIESYTIPKMAHGTPVGVGGDGCHYGQSGAHLLDVGISSSWHATKFFGLVGKVSVAGDTVAPTQSFSRMDSKTGSPENSLHTNDIKAVITRALTAAGLLK